MTEEEKKDRRVVMTIDMDEELNEGAMGTKNLGYAIPLAIYHQLSLDKFIKSKAVTRASEPYTAATQALSTMT